MGDATGWRSNNRQLESNNIDLVQYLCCLDEEHWNKNHYRGIVSNGGDLVPLCFQGFQPYLM